MATIPVTVTEGEARTFIATWTNLSTGDVGEPIRYAGAADRTVQVFGDFGGATVTLEGTLEQVPTTWLPLNDAQGNPIEITEARLEAITELVRQVRPVVAGGTGTAVTVMMLMRQTI
jgi:hypothetical protein